MTVISLLQNRIVSALKLETVKIILGFALLFACSQVIIPLKPVPITLQTVAIMLLGLLYSRETALKSFGVYLTAGAVGIPVFAGFSAGTSILLGTTAGYFLGFGLCVALMTSLRQRYGLNTFWGMVLNCTLGTAVIFICGIAWLSTIVGWSQALQLGLLPLIIPGCVKTLLLSGAIRFVRR